MLQIAGASAWLVAGGPWPPALAALSVGAGLLATIPRAPKQRRVVDLREVPSTDLIPGMTGAESHTGERVIFLPQPSVAQAIQRSKPPTDQASDK